MKIDYLSLFLLILIGIACADQAAICQELSDYFNNMYADSSSDTEFKFGVNADNHINSAYGIDKTADPVNWTKALNMWKDSGCVFATCVGDLGYGGQEQVATMKAGMNNVPDMTILPAMGNHENDGVGKVPWVDSIVPGVVSHSSWEQLDGKADNVYYSFDYGAKYHFIVLDCYLKESEIVPQLDSAQVRWFINDVRTNYDKHLFVFIHAPPQYDGDEGYLIANRGILLGELSDHITATGNKVFLFHGHLHSIKRRILWGVHIHMFGSNPAGVISVNGDDISISATNVAYGSTISMDPFRNLDNDLANMITVEGEDSVLRICDDSIGGVFKSSDNFSMVGGESGVEPQHGTKMINRVASNYFESSLLSDQVIKVRPGMKYSYKIYRTEGTGTDNIILTPNHIVPGNFDRSITVCNDDNICLPPSRSIYPRYDYYHPDVDALGGKADEQWYTMEFDLDHLAQYEYPSYLANWQLQGKLNTAETGTYYIDDIKISWPADGVTEKEERASVEGDDIITARPNPFNPSTTINFKLQNTDFRLKDLKVEVFTIEGKLIEDLTPSVRNLKSNIFNLKWNAASLSSGVYIVAATIGNRMYSKRITLMK